MIQNLPRGSEFNKPSPVHDGKFVCHGGGHVEVM
jgi:hypothetical protein